MVIYCGHKYMKNPAILPDPVGHLLQLLQDTASRRLVIGLVGLPGSGKSTLAANLVESINQATHSEIAVALSMDGFHLTKAALTQFADPTAALARRGAPWTFDPVGLADKLQQLRKTPYQSNTWPDFQHGVGDPVADVIVIPPDAKLIIVEGLYLLHREHGWNVAHLLDECWALNTPPELAQSRLIARHMASWGFSREQALARLALNDALNADIVLKTLQSADYIVF
jgi:pantothenate kinase